MADRSVSQAADRSGRQSEASQRAGDTRSVHRALDILEVLGNAPTGGLTLSELAIRAMLAPSTTHRLLTSLQERRFVHFAQRTRRWSVGASVLAIGTNYAGTRDLVGLALPIMERMAQSCGETINLGIIDEGRVRFLMRVDPRERRHFVPSSGAGVPVHGSSIGKAILSEMPLDEVCHALEPAQLTPLTGKTLVAEGDLMRDIGDTYRRGFALDDEENTVGLRCIAAAVLDEYRCPVAALSLAAPVERLRNGQIEQRGRMVAESARRLTAAFAGHAA